MTGAARASVEVPAAPHEAFVCFADVAAWWPAELTWSQDALESLEIEPRVGGLCRERGPGGFTCDWGRVLEWEEGRRLAIAWSIGAGREPVPDPERASRVSVTFSPAAGGTRVDVAHDRFERHGPGAEGYREAMEQGWRNAARALLGPREPSPNRGGRVARPVALTVRPWRPA